MKKEEDLILHGRYFFRKIVDEELPFASEEVFWLSQTSLRNGKNWRGEDGHLQKKQIEKTDYLDSFAATNMSVEEWLSFLQSVGYIKFSKDSSSCWHIAITGTGAQRARELDTWWGRLNIFYKEKKDGVLWLFATILVSLITSLISNYFKRNQ